MKKKSTDDSRTEVRLPAPLKRALRVYCAQNDLSIQECVIHAIKGQIETEVLCNVTNQT